MGTVVPSSFLTGFFFFGEPFFLPFGGPFFWLLPALPILPPAFPNLRLSRRPSLPQSDLPRLQTSTEILLPSVCVCLLFFPLRLSRSRQCSLVHPAGRGHCQDNATRRWQVPRLPTLLEPRDAPLSKSRRQRVRLKEGEPEIFDENS